MQIPNDEAPRHKLEELPGRPSVHRTPAEKARILARLTLQLAALNKEEGSANGDA